MSHASSFATCRKLEALSRHHLRQHLLPFLAFEGRYVHVDKGEMAREFQLKHGDYVFNSDDDTAWRVEHKCEESNKYGNFFIETFSNKQRGNPGWFWKNEADFLLYHFIREGEVYLMRLPALRGWLYSHETPGVPRIHRYREKAQGKHEQLNDTWGYCVRIADVVAGINVQVRHVPPLRIEDMEAA
jgi:hypothetical protein